MEYNTIVFFENIIGVQNSFAAGKDVKGIKLINNMNNFECIIVDENNKFITSTGIELNIQ